MQHSEVSYREPAPMPPQPEPGARVRKITWALLVVTFSIIPINVVVYLGMLKSQRGSNSSWFYAFFLLAAFQSVIGLVALVSGLIYAAQLKNAQHPYGKGLAMAGVGLLGALGGFVGGVLGFVPFLISMGGSWGRPLRIRGRVMHPELKGGSDWTLGAMPSCTGLDEDTRTALEALWLHDAQKEHASVPAFARVTWMLTAVGAPAELVERTLTAAQEEVAHTRLCFALAAGYGGRSHTVDAMPDLVLGGALDVRGDVFEHLAMESLKDGCLLEDYNADVAAECATQCDEPVTRRVLDQIAREERSHAELSWSILAWCIARGGERVRKRCMETLATLHEIPRPTAVSHDKSALVARADAAKLRAHGRLPDERWAVLYDARLISTRDRLHAMTSNVSLAA
jgi:hypothetical protein